MSIIQLCFLSAAISLAFGADSEFCYRDSTCGPESDKWPGVCQSGQRQSPINLQAPSYPLGIAKLQLSVYKGSLFRMRNNGHTVQIDFGGEGASSQNLTFPDPLKISFSDHQGQRQYKFSSAHFHWDVSDKSGSEHCISSRCSAMELHFVHYMANFSSVQQALASNDESALAVLGVLIDASSSRNCSNLAPIVDNLDTVEDADEDGTNWVIVNEALDLSKIISEAGSMLYSYKGSLTTPTCDEQVNWYVMGKSAKVSKQETQAFRSMIRDGGDAILENNHRPLQNTNKRKILFSKVKSS